MDTRRWHRVRRLFDDVVNAAPSDWVRLLRAACPDDDGLRTEVLQLLKADRQATSQDSRIAGRTPDLLMDIAQTADARQAEAWTKRQLGAWRILREIGHGGMGRVYLAERGDGEYRQHAALKMLRYRADSDDALRRFMAERQILAQLDHPSIAHLLDGGSSEESGPWFALEHVDGVPITQWCDREKLGLQNRLQLFLEVCGAVSYAHGRLVVHRDLKPANILVNAESRVKLLDFGIAKLLDADGAQTGTALRAFTPEYAAPEQIRGDPITTAVDVYALGIVLYELLTGRHPYRTGQSTPATYELAALEQAVHKPSSVVTQSSVHPQNRDHDETALARHRRLTPKVLKHRLRGDLDAIVLKALRKEPEARYASVAEFADDVRAVLTHRPVSARRGSARYFIGRFIRRNRLAVGMAVLAVAALAAGLTGALWQAHEARVQRDTAQQSLDFMTDLFRNADPAMRRQTDLTVKDLLDEGVRNIRYAMPERSRSRGKLLLAMSAGYLGLYDGESAKPLISEAIGIARASDDPIALAEGMILECTRLILDGHGRACLPIAEETEALLDAENPNHAASLAKLLDHRAIQLSAMDRHEEAVSTAQRSLAAASRAPDSLRLRSNALGTLTFSLVELGRAQEAVALMRSFMDELRAADAVPPRLLADALDNLASALVRTGSIDESVRLQREALSTMETLYGENSPVIAVKLNNLAAALQRAGRPAEAYPLMQRALDVRRIVFHAEDDSLVNGMNNLGALAFMLERDSEALGHLDEAIAIADRAGAITPRHLGLSLWWRGTVLFALGRYADAESDLVRNREVFAALHPDDHPRLLRSRALSMAIAVASEGREALSNDTCGQIDAIIDAYGRAAADSKTEAEVAFAEFLGELCVNGDSATTLTPEMTDQAMTRLTGRLESGEYRLRLARRTVAALTPPH